jgi:hypothetical protein
MMNLLLMNQWSKTQNLAQAYPRSTTKEAHIAMEEEDIIIPFRLATNAG